MSFMGNLAGNKALSVHGKGDYRTALKLYEEACLLVNYCKNKLEESKGQIIDINERVEKAKKNNESIESLFED